MVARDPSIFGSTDRDTQDDLIRENIEVTRRMVAALERMEKKNGNGNNGNGKKDRDFLRIAVTLAITIALGAHGLLWYLDKTVAVQTEQIYQLRNDVSELPPPVLLQDVDDLKQWQLDHLRDHNGR